MFENWIVSCKSCKSWNQVEKNKDEIIWSHDKSTPMLHYKSYGKRGKEKGEGCGGWGSPELSAGRPALRSAHAEALSSYCIISKSNILLYHHCDLSLWIVCMCACASMCLWCGYDRTFDIFKAWCPVALLRCVCMCVFCVPCWSAVYKVRLLFSGGHFKE